MAPMLEVARPTLCGDIPNPPLNTKGKIRGYFVGLLGLYRRVDRKRSHRLLNALVINLSVHISFHDLS